MNPLEISDLSVSFRTTLFSGLSLKIPQGEFVTLMGENGSGKTCLVEAMMGFFRPEKGTISFWGEESSRVDRAWLDVFSEAGSFWIIPSS